MTPQLPRPDQYQEAIQNPGVAFTDPELRACRVAINPLGLPMADTGGFAVTYKLAGASGTWAVRCFYKPVADRQERYAEITRFLAQHRNGYFTPAEYQPAGIRVRGVQYPITKMAWIAGLKLNAFVERNLTQPSAISEVAAGFRAMVEHLETIGMAHGDLQHGNILVDGRQLRLIDYDGMYVPGLAGRRSAEDGLPQYQHPLRPKARFGPSLDRFSAIVIYLALRAAAARPQLWRQYALGAENMMFQPRDFVDPHGSKLLKDLEQVPELTRWVHGLRQVCGYTDLTWVPPLAEFLEGRLRPAPASTGPRAPVTLQRPFEVISASLPGTLLERIGERVEVVGLVTDTHMGFTRWGNRPYMFVNFGNWRKKCFTLVLWEQTLDAFAQARVRPEALQGQWISVTGVIGQYNGRPEIALDSPREIEWLGGESEAQRRLRPEVVVPVAAPPVTQAAALPRTQVAPPAAGAASRGQDRDAALERLYGGRATQPFQAQPPRPTAHGRGVGSTPGTPVGQGPQVDATKRRRSWKDRLKQLLGG